MKTPLLLAVSLAALDTASAGDFNPMITGESSSLSNDPFARAIRPITAPTVFDLAVPRTQIHGIYMRQNLSNTINTTIDPTLPLGGNFNLYALQFEVALDERTSIVATKDGYLDFNPENTLTPESGFANLGIGIKRALIYRPETSYILSGIASLEIPIGDSEVWQGNGDGALNLNLAGLKLYDRLQIASNLGLHLPFDDSQSFTGSMSLHASYEIKTWFIPLIEINWFHVFNEGDGTSTFDHQLGSTVPTLARFEGGDLINLGAANGGDSEIVTVGIGFRSRINENANLGFAYEIPLTDEEDNLMKNRLTIDFVYQF